MYKLNSDQKIDAELLVDRQLYVLLSRNLAVGVWNAESLGFIGLRQKFDDIFLFTEYEYDIAAGTAHALQVIPDSIVLVTTLGLFCCVGNNKLTTVYDENKKFISHNHDDDDDTKYEHDDKQHVENEALHIFLEPYDSFVRNIKVKIFDTETRFASNELAVALKAKLCILFLRINIKKVIKNPEER